MSSEPYGNGVIRKVRIELEGYGVTCRLRFGGMCGMKDINRFRNNNHRGVKQLITKVKAVLFNWTRNTYIFTDYSLSTILCN